MVGPWPTSSQAGCGRLAVGGAQPGESPLRGSPASLPAGTARPLGPPPQTPTRPASKPRSGFARSISPPPPPPGAPPPRRSRSTNRALLHPASFPPTRISQRRQCSGRCSAIARKGRRSRPLLAHTAVSSARSGESRAHIRNEFRPPGQVSRSTVQGGRLVSTPQREESGIPSLAAR